MPTLNIQGQKVKVDDSFLKLSPEDQNATVEEIASKLGIASTSKPPGQVSSLTDQVLAGFERPTEDIGVSMEEAGKATGWTGMESAGKGLRDLTDGPENFVSAGSRFINPEKGDSYVDPITGLGWGNALGGAAELVGGFAGQIAARSTGAAIGGVAGPKGAVVGAFAGPALFEFIRQVGPNAKQIAANNGYEDPTWQDWTQAAATAGVSGALESIGIKGIGQLNQGLKVVGKKTATKVITEAATETGKKVLKEGATEVGQSIVDQYGTTAGTKVGARIDLKQAVGEGILGGVAGGGIDVASNARSTGRNVLDIRAVDKANANDPYARDEAEITRDVNRLAARPQQKGKELQGAEVTAYVADLKNQAQELIKKQRLAPDDQSALIKGLNTAKGLTDERLNQIAGRSDSPDEIKAIAHRVQLVRSMTVQQQAHKGARGLLASGLKYGGGAAGAAVGQQLGTGAVEGALIGTSVGRWLGNKVSTSQTQGARIDALVGAKQARRAKLLLERYGPSDATTAMNTLTERGLAKEAEAKAQDEAISENNRIINEMKVYQKEREVHLKNIEKAATAEEKAKAKAEKAQHDSVNRELKLKNLSLAAVGKEARNKAILEKLEASKAMNALTIEMTQVQLELDRKTAEAKAQGLDRKRDFDINNIKGQLQKLAADIQIRQEAAKKASIATSRAEKMSALAPVKMAKTLSKIRGMGASWQSSVDADGNILNKAAYKSTVDYLDPLRQEAQAAINNETDPKLRRLLRETLSDLMSLKNNWDARHERFKRAMSEAKQLGGDADQKVHDLLYQLANYKSLDRAPDELSSDDNVPDEDPPF
jgi:hypothetical protein